MDGAGAAGLLMTGGSSSALDLPSANSFRPGVALDGVVSMPAPGLLSSTAESQDRAALSGDTQAISARVSVFPRETIDWAVAELTSIGRALEGSPESEDEFPTRAGPLLMLLDEEFLSDLSKFRR